MTRLPRFLGTVGVVVRAANQLLIIRRIEIMVLGEQETMRNMNTVKKTKWIAIAAVLAATLTGPLAAARDTDAPVVPKKKKKSPALAVGDSREVVRMQLRRYAVTYGLNDDDQARIEKILTAQQKDLADFAKVHGPQIKAVDDQIKKLQDEITRLEKTKDVHIKARGELELDHQAELDKAFTTEQKTARLVASLKGYDNDTYWEFLPKDVQAALNQQCQDAAVELISGGNDQSRTALKDASRKLHASIDKALTPELRQAAETQYLRECAVRNFARYELTDDQKARIGELCAKSVKDKVAVSGRYSQLAKDLGAMKQTMSQYRGSLHALKVRLEIAEKILTEEQRKRVPGKYKTAAKKEKKAKPATKKSTRRAPPSS